MDWENYGEVKARALLLGDRDLSASVLLFALSSMIRNGRFTVQSQNIDGLAAVCPISDYGAKIISLSKCGTGLSDDESSLLCLTAFYYRDFLLDIARVDVSKTMEIINSIVLDGSIEFPDSHGRILYDRFKSSYAGRRLDFLSVEDSNSLTQETENGVYQVGYLVTGPLGILLSTESRMLPPNPKVPLWHCADPGCGILHLVRLSGSETKVTQAERHMKSWLKQTDGPPSDWENAFSSLSRNHRRQSYFDINALMSDGLDLSEQRALLEESLSSEEGKSLREVIAAKIDRKTSLGSAKDVASRMTSNQIVQILSILTNSSIVQLIDSLVFKDRISIPKSETRSIKTPVPKRRGDYTSSISSLGIRANKNEPASLLATIIFKAYSKANNLDDLAWRCKTSQATAAGVVTYIATKGPKAAVSDLVMPTKDVFGLVCAAFNLIPDNIPQENSEDFILWKSGFTVPRYDDYLSLFRNALGIFNETIIGMPIKANDIDREKIRSSASNVFVYAERFIQELVAFNTWLLFSDHFIDNGFEFRLKDALKSVSKVCGDHIEIKGSVFHWNNDGNNTLGNLLVFGRRLIEIIEQLNQNDASELIRPQSAYPHYASPTDDRFPFKHTQLWADANGGLLSDHLNSLKSIFTFLDRAKIAETRNAIQHYRDSAKFPSRASLLECVSMLNAALDSADIGNFVPKQFWFVRHDKDAYAISRWTMVDYNGREIEVTLPYTFNGLISPRFGRAYIVESSALLGEAAGKLIFVHRERSRFSDLWDNYDQVPSVAEADIDDLINVGSQ